MLVRGRGKTLENGLSHGSRGLTTGQLSERVGRLRLVIADNDGTLTDAAVWYSEAGELLKRYSLRDGHGVEILREAGIETAILTREGNEIALRRAEKLKLEWVFKGIRDKASFLDTVLAETGLNTGQIAYIGDDVNDLGVMQRIAPEGLIACPADAHSTVREVVHFISPNPGGHGAFRAFADWLLSVRSGNRTSDILPEEQA